MAETAVMCLRAGIESRPGIAADLMSMEVRLLRVSSPNFYLARELKQVNDYELNKIRFTRLAGAIVYPGGAYAVYNNRDQMLNWMGEGERKIRNHLHSIFTPMQSFSYPLRQAAVMLGNSYDVALDMMEEFRPLVVDSVVISLINRGEISRADFLETARGTMLKDSGRRQFWRAWARRLDTEVTHPAFGYRMSYRRMMEVQMRQLWRFCRGDVQFFHGFVTR